jgi:hypothetical protein
MFKDKKTIEQIYNKAKGDKQYYTFDLFMRDARAFIQDIKKHNITCTIKPSRSGMSRKFNFIRYNQFLNTCYNGKCTRDLVNVSGCGMDMYWYLLFTTCAQLFTPEYMEKHNINSECSRQIYL